MKKNIKWKVAAFALMFVFVLVCTMKLTATASAIPVDNVDVNYSYETVTVTTNDKIVYYTDKYTKDISRWDACEVRNGKAVFDISWITASKTVRLYLCGDVNTEISAVDITWEEDFSVEFTGTLLTTDITEAKKWQNEYKKYPNFSEDTGYLIFTLREEGREVSYFDLDTIQWRKGDDGTWRDFKDLDLKEMNIRGIKLEFQIVADNDNETRASDVAGVTISRLNEKPIIVVDSDAVTVNIKNGMEFSFNKEDWMMIPAYSRKFGTDNYFVTETEREAAIETIYTTKRVTEVLAQELIKSFNSNFSMNTPMDQNSLKNASGFPEEYFTEEGLKLYVREIGTGRRAASKIAEVTIPYAANGKSSADAKALDISYGESKTNTAGIVVKNNTDIRYQVSVIAPGSEMYDTVQKYVTDKTEVKDYAIDLNDINWTGVKGGKSFRFSNKKVPENSYLIFRIGGENGYLPSSYLFFGPMEYNQLTYAGLVAPKKINGQIATAVVSTNLYDEKSEKLLPDAGLTFIWERCADIKADEPKWETIKEVAGQDGMQYEFTKDDKDCYVRVKIVQKVIENGEETTVTMYSGEVGPIKYVEPIAAPTPEVTP